MANLPEDMVNRALDAIGADDTIGDMAEGTVAAAAARRIYIPTLEQVLRGAHWNFARKQAPMTLLGDATGQTPNVGTQVIQPWLYEYAWPTDCVAVWYVPWNPLTTVGPGAPPGNIVPSDASAPLFAVNPAVPPIPRIRPARFLVTSDTAYPLTGDAENPGEWWNVRGTALQVRNVILTNVKCADLIYTVWLPYPNLWDSLFQEAFVAIMASKLAMPVLADKKFALAERDRQIMIARQALDEARAQDGNEGWHSADIRVDWLSARRAGGGWGSGWGAGDTGLGVLGYGWDAVGFGNGSAY